MTGGNGEGRSWVSLAEIGVPPKRAGPGLSGVPEAIGWGWQRGVAADRETCWIAVGVMAARTVCSYSRELVLLPFAVA